MGWLFGYNTRKELIDHLVSGNGVKTIKHCFVGNNMWTVQEYTREVSDEVLGYKTTETRRFICLYLMRGRNDSRDGWGYKDVTEDMGPNETSCPASYLDMVPDPGGYATEWRARVRSRALKAKQKFSVGQQVTLYGKSYKITQVFPRGRYRIDDGEYGVYIATRRHIRHMEVMT